MPWAKSFWAFSPSYTTCECSVILTKVFCIAPKELNLKITIFPYVSSLISNFYMNKEHF